MYEHSRSSKKTRTFTFRIDSETLKSLQSESDAQNITLNTLINKILKRYVEWDTYEPKLDMIPMARQVISGLFNLMTEEEISYLANNFGRNAVKDISLFMKMGLDPNSFLKWFESRMKRSFIEFNSTQNNDHFTCILKHNMGYNWSLYHKKILEKIFNEVFNKQVNIETSEYMLTFKFKLD
ncbi:MAG: hypothetical protein DA328_08295 [Nitrososphaeraceae archaeon]|nr:hypothetical protein [Nitrososphaeraceae archaeon]